MSVPAVGLSEEVVMLGTRRDEDLGLEMVMEKWCTPKPAPRSAEALSLTVPGISEGVQQERMSGQRR